MRAWLSRMLDLIFLPSSDARIVREASFDSLKRHISPRLSAATSPPTTVILPFRIPHAAALIREAKYHASAVSQEILGQLLAEYLRDHAGDAVRRTVLVPIPLSRRRRRERGFNQCEEVARCALARIPESAIVLDTNTLRRVKDSEHQARLGRSARLMNMDGAFVAANVDPDTAYILLDDVITTGSTMRAAITALQSAGAAHILPVALAG